MFDAETIVHTAEQSFGHPFETMAFHAYDDNQMPIGAPLHALDYAHWLNTTYSGQPIETLRSISNQYDVAIQSAKNSPGILPEALGNLVLSGAVFHALTQGSAERAATPVPTSNLSSSARYTEPPTSGSTPVSTINRPETAAYDAAQEEKNTLLRLRDELIESLHIPSPYMNHEELVAHIKSMVEEKKKVLTIEHAQHRMSQEGMDEEIQKLQRSLMQKALQLQSINARMGDNEVADTRTPEAQNPSKITPLPNTESLDALRAEEQKLITEIQHLDSAVQHSSLREQQLRRIQTHIQIVEQLLQIIREETTE